MGVGPNLERQINELGVTSYRQIAARTDEDIARIQTLIWPFPGRVRRDGPLKRPPPLPFAPYYAVISAPS